MLPTFTGICLVSRDVLRLASFYTDLPEGSVVDGNDVFAFVRLPGAQLSIFRLDEMDEMAPARWSPPAAALPCSSSR